MKMIALVLDVPSALICVWVRSLVLLSYLGWFVAPLWPAMPPVPAYAAMGLCILPQIVRVPRRDTEDEKEQDPMWRVVRSGLESVLTSGILWLFGALIVWVAR